MEVKTEFAERDWDTISETSTFHLSYFIQLLLPTRNIGWKKENKFHKPFKIPQINGIDHICIPTGSTSEGLNIPRCILNGSMSSNYEVFSDTDLLCVPNTFKISAEEMSKPGLEYVGCFDSYNISPGYTRISLPNKKTNENVSTFDGKRGKLFLNSAKFLKGAYANAKVFLDEEKDTWTQGPALSVKAYEIVQFQEKFDPHAGVPADLVLALPCYPWPSVANKWKSRAKSSPWLQPRLIESILQDGCHVVGVPTKNSVHPDLEWRISFSASEGRLAREAVTDYQRQCYIYLKILRYQVMKLKPILSSYVFKSVFFHCCEKLPPSYWRDSPGSCVLYMLDVLLECLKGRHVPTYFVPENNLIMHLTDEELEKAITDVQKLRVNPISPILEFTNKRSFAYHSGILTFGSMVEPLLKDMKAFAVHRNKLRSVENGIYLTGVTICHMYLSERMEEKYQQFELQKHQEGIHTLIHLYTHWLKPLSIEDMPLPSFIAVFGLQIEDCRQSLSFYEAVVSLGESYPELMELRGNLASLYHVYAYLQPSSSERDLYLRKAGILFKDLYNKGMQSAIDYMTYLVKQRKFNEAICIVEEFLSTVEEKDNIIYSYTEKEMAIIDDNLTKHIEMHGPVSGDALSFAYYYLIRCLCETGEASRSSQVEATLRKLELHSKEIPALCTFDFYKEAKKICEETKSIHEVVSSATTCMLMATVPAILFVFLIRTLEPH